MMDIPWTEGVLNMRKIGFCYKVQIFLCIQALVEKDWLAFGHPFSDRLGMPTVSGSESIPEITRQASTGNLNSSPVRQSSTSQSTTSHAQNSCSPIFLQVDALDILADITDA